MKTPLSRWLLLPAVILLLGCPSWLDAAEPKKRRSSRPPSEIRRVFDRIGDFFAHAARDLEGWEQGEAFDDPFFQPQPYPMPGTGVYPVHPELEEYFLFRELNPYGRTDPRTVPPHLRQRQSLTLPPPRDRYLPYYQTLGRESAPRQLPSSGPGSALSYRPLTPSIAGEAPRSSATPPLPADAAGRDRLNPPPSSAPSPGYGADSRANAGVPRTAPSTTPAPNIAPQKPAVLQNLPTAKPVPGRPGLVYPPGAEDGSTNMVDVRGFTPGQKVSDPRTGKIFLVP